MRYLVNGLKQLPNSLKVLKLDLRNNKLGENEENMKIIGDIIK